MTDICDRVVLIEKGEIKFVGRPQDAVKRYYELQE